MRRSCTAGTSEARGKLYTDRHARIHKTRRVFRRLRRVRGAAGGGARRSGAVLRRRGEDDSRARGGAARRHRDVAVPRDGVSGADRRVRPSRSGDQRDHHAQPERAARGRSARSRARDPRPARSAPRDSGARQGQLRHDRHADDRRLRRAARLASGSRRVSGAQAARRRRGDSRQDEPARVRARHHDGQLARRPDEESVRSDAQPRRLERRHRRRRRGELRGGRHGHRHVRIDPLSRVREQSRRACVRRWGCRAGAASCRSRCRRTWAARSRAP